MEGSMSNRLSGTTVRALALGSWFLLVACEGAAPPADKISAPLQRNHTPGAAFGERPAPERSPAPAVAVQDTDDGVEASFEVDVFPDGRPPVIKRIPVDPRRPAATTSARQLATEK
jgi:hypothetical protein